jgi:8-oxo-dGTP diphosphatase
MTAGGHSYLPEHEPLRYCPRCAGAFERRPVEGRLRLVCTSCGRVYYENPRVAAALILEQDGAVLLGRRVREPIGKWDLPAGFVEIDEHPADAAVREAFEETGLRVEITSLLDVYADTTAGIVLIVYTGRVAGGELRLNPEETSELAFFPRDALPPDEELAFANTRRALKAWAARW